MLYPSDFGRGYSIGFEHGEENERSRIEHLLADELESIGKEQESISKSARLSLLKKLLQQIED